MWCSVCVVECGEEPTRGIGRQASMRATLQRVVRAEAGERESVGGYACRVSDRRYVR